MRKLFFTTLALLLLTKGIGQGTWSGTTPGNIHYTLGNVGIGTTAPLNRLHIKGDAGNPAWVSLEKSSSSEEAGLSLKNGSNYLFYLYSDNTDGEGLKIQAGWEADAAPRLHIPYNNNNLYLVQSGGNVGIGTTAPGSYKLAVEGKIGARKVVVTQNSWADYVFEKEYRLRPLTEVEAFIQQHQHLPDVPSAKEIEEKGLDVGENQATLLKKIEELTLYIIEQQKQIEALKQEKSAFSELKQEIDKLKKQIKKK